MSQICRIFVTKLDCMDSVTSKIEQQIRCLIKTGRSIFSYWDDKKASQLLEKYVYELKKSEMNEEQIVSDLKDNVYRMMNDTRSWSGWKLKIEN